MSDLAFPKQGRKPKKSKAISKLRKFAQGKPCTLRLFEICNDDVETVVLCHVKPKGHGAMGSKPSDIHAIHACSDCHDVIDGRSNSAHYSSAEIQSEILRALFETQNLALEAGLIKLVGVK